MKRIELSKLLKEPHGGQKSDEVVAETPTTQRGGESKLIREVRGGDCVGRGAALCDMEMEGPSSLSRNPLRRKSSLGGEKDKVICPPSVAKYLSGVENSTEKSDSTPKCLPNRNMRRRSSLLDPLQDVTPKSILGAHRRTGESLSRAVTIRNANGDVRNPVFETPRRGTPMSVQEMAHASPGVFIPSMKELEVTGTELAEDMAGNLVAGIFSISEPNPDVPKHLLGTSENSFGQPAEEMEKQSVQDSIPSSDAVHEPVAWYPLHETGRPISLLFRFPDSCLYAKYSASKNHVAVLLGCPIDKEPREILIFSVFKTDAGEYAVKILQSIHVQKSKYFPVCIPYNVNFFTLCETKKGDPVLVVSSALECMDAMTQAYQPCLHVIPCGAKSISSNIVSIESDQPIVFVESLAGSPYSLAVSGQFAEDGIQIIEFDPLWQSFKWGRKYTSSPDMFHSVPTTHISKLLSMEGKLSAVLASDSSSDDIVFSWTSPECDGTILQHVENAEIFSDGTSLMWFLCHKDKIKELCFAGEILTDSEKGKKAIRSASVIFACEGYVALGDIHGDIQVWDVLQMLSKKISLSSLSDANEKRINSIAQIHVGADNKNGLFITSASGLCTIVSYDELFTI